MCSAARAHVRVVDSFGVRSLSFFYSKHRWFVASNHVEVDLVAGIYPGVKYGYNTPFNAHGLIWAEKGWWQHWFSICIPGWGSIPPNFK